MIICAFCKEEFLSQDATDRHLRSNHRGQRSVTCAIDGCTEKFLTYNSRNKHRLKVHNGKRYGCTVCQKEFAVKSAVSAHERRVHSARKISCPYCLIRIKRGDNLRRHITTKHTTTARDINEAPIMQDDVPASYEEEIF